MRIMTGAACRRRRHRGDAGSHTAPPTAVTSPPAAPGRTSAGWRRPARWRCGPPGPIRPPMGLVASSGASVTVTRRLRVFFSTGDEVATPGRRRPRRARSTTATATRCSACSAWASTSSTSASSATTRTPSNHPARSRRHCRRGHHQRRRRSGEADFTREVMARLGSVLFWKIAMKPGCRWPSGASAATMAPPAVRPARQPGGGDGHFISSPARRCCASPASTRCLSDPAGRPVTPIRKAPGRTEFLRGVLFHWRHWLAGEEHHRPRAPASLSSMADANCFIVLGPDQDQRGRRRHRAGPGALRLGLV